MSVLIKGFPLPNNCGACPLRLAWCRERIYMVTRPERCPLSPVPPNMRLIDADKQDAQIEALIERHLHGYTKSTWDFVCELRDILKRNRTIIPAEDEHTMEEFMHGQEGNPNDGSM